MCISSKSHWSICQLQQIDWLSLKFFPEYLKPIAAREREVEAARAKEKAELEAIKKAEAAKGLFVCTWNMLCSVDHVLNPTKVKRIPLP